MDAPTNGTRKFTFPLPHTVLGDLNDREAATDEVLKRADMPDFVETILRNQRVILRALAAHFGPTVKFVAEQAEQANRPRLVVPSLRLPRT